MTKAAMFTGRALFLVALASCAGTPTDSADASADVAPLPGFGEACPTGTCAAGLTCQDSEYAPFPWCTLPCTTVKTPCDKAQLGGRAGLCIQMPTGWRGPTEPFCAPTCGNSSQCTPLDTRWETCTNPGYKGKPFYGDVGKVCAAPSANGQIHVDPITCDWQNLVTDPKVQDLKGMCNEFCTFLTTCQLKASGQTKDCCTWQCFQHLAPGGVTDEARKAAIQCYISWYSKNTESTILCSGYVDQCGALCKDDVACNDFNACSTDVCRDWRCENTPIEGCK